MINTRLQTGESFQYRKQIKELLQGIQSNLLRITKTLNQINKEAQNYVNIANLMKKVFTEPEKLKAVKKVCGEKQKIRLKIFGSNKTSNETPKKTVKNVFISSTIIMTVMMTMTIQTLLWNIMKIPMMMAILMALVMFLKMRQRVTNS